MTKIARVAPPSPLFNVCCKFDCPFLDSTAWNSIFRLRPLLSQADRGKFGVSLS